MEDGRILDTGINASSSRTPAKNCRLNYTLGSSWCAGTSDTNPYLQIDLQTLHIICAVSTQGNSQADQWVKTYTLQLSIDGTTWTDYKELGGQVKVLNTFCIEILFPKQLSFNMHWLLHLYQILISMQETVNSSCP